MLLSVSVTCPGQSPVPLESRGFAVQPEARLTSLPGHSLSEPRPLSHPVFLDPSCQPGPGQCL